MNKKDISAVHKFLNEQLRYNQSNIANTLLNSNSLKTKFDISSFLLLMLYKHMSLVHLIK